jgi:hypothetical protein
MLRKLFTQRPINLRTLRMMVLFGLLSPSLCLAEQPSMHTEKNDRARAFAQALKMSGVYPQRGPQQFDYDFAAESIRCHTSNASEDGLMEYDCLLNTLLKIEGAPAKVLYDAMVALNVLVDAGMSQTHVTATNVHCQNNSKTAGVYECQWVSEIERR